MSEGVDLIDIYADEEFNQTWVLHMKKGCRNWVCLSLMKRTIKDAMIAMFQYLRGCHKEEEINLFSKDMKAGQEAMDGN